MKRLSLVIILTIALKVNAQQDAMYSHYSFNTLAINPAYAGTRDALTVTGLNRNQWLGFPGAPTTQTLTLHTPVHNNKIGLGLSVINDKVGPISNTAAYADFAYHIQVGVKSKLAFGLKGGFNMMQARLSSLKTIQPGDMLFAENIQSSINPNFGFGMYYYRERFYAGISSPKLLENKFAIDQGQNTVSRGKEQRHFYAIAGTVFDINRTLKLRPTALLKVTPSSPIEADFTALFIAHDRVEFGPMYRTGDAFGLLLGYSITPQMRFGYSFDWSFTNKTGRYNQGSHEVMLRYDFIYKDKAKVYSPRYF